MKKNENDFELVCDIRSKARDIPIYKFRSLKTGLHVIIAKVEGPIVQGYLTIATEAHDDDGLPHTLEHLVFLGSEDYPYKGVLDLLANRCLAEGTNAWTDIDHTTYTMMTAGSEGFLNLLPIYLDHLLFPTITDAGFMTEVYHINDQGGDAGVVYSEMQARENTGPELTYNKLVRALYPDTSGYHYETGGMMANIRDSLSLEKIRNYHMEMYRSENLHVIITGQVEPEDVFKALEPLEAKIINKGEKPPYERPWQSPIPPFSTSQDLDIVYPSDSEDTSIVRIGWRGPSIVTHLTEFQSMEVLMEYLTEVSVSPLPKVFVETDDPLASYVDEYLLRFSISSCTLNFFGVPKHKINDIKPLLMDTFEKIVDGTTPFDIDVMRNTINNLILKEESLLETSPHYTFAQYIIHDLLYGRDCADLNREINQIEWYEHLLTEPTSYWTNLIKKYFLDAPSVVVKGLPSAAEANRLQEEERNRIEMKKVELGEDGLKRVAENVIEAERLNDIPPPESMLESVPVPSTSTINFHSLNVYTNINNHHSGFIAKSDPKIFDLDAVPIKMQLDDVKSNFVEIVAILDTHSLSPEERMYIPLLLDLLLESNIAKIGGSLMHYEDVVKDLNADTLKAETQSGLYMKPATFTFGSYFHNIGINLEVEMAKYERGVEWTSDILFRDVFSAERVAVKASKLLNSIGDKKREGNTILKLMYNDVVFKDETNVNKANALRQENFLNQVIENLKTNPDKILNNLNNVYKNITQVDNIIIHMATNFELLSSVTNTTKPWLNFLPKEFQSANMSLNVINDWQERVPFSVNRNGTGYVVGMGSVESGYLLQTTPSITSYTHADLPALMTAITYLTQLEGPMWKRIRGKGLAYSYSITLKPNEGTLTLQLARATRLTDAYKEAERIIISHVNGSTPWERLLFESARSSLIYEIIEREAEISDAVQQSLYAYYRKVPHDYNRALLKAIDEVTIEDMNGVSLKYFKQMLDPELSKTVAVCPSNKVTEVETELTKMGHTIEIINKLDDCVFARL